MMSGRHDLLDGAVTDFERDLAIDVEDHRRTGRRSNTTLLLDHCTPMRLLFPYYLRSGQRDKALEAAKRMLEREPVDGMWAFQLFDFLVANGPRALAEQSLQRMLNCLQPTQPEVAADALSRFGQQWSDRSSLEQSRRIYEELAKQNPTEARLHRKLEAVRDLLSPTTTTRGSPLP